MTCNPQWPEICDNLKPGQIAQDRPDLVSRVFRAKLEDLKEQLLKKHLLEEVKAYIYVIEFQKHGHDKQVIQIDPDEQEVVINEIKRFQDACYVSPPEAMWRIFSFPLSQIIPALLTLQVHLPNKQMVRFRDDDIMSEVVDWERDKKTMLTAFFETNRLN
ncbi:uncharacterized protein LOC143606551 [Bidens hawaiensis]|uniref:uncharacterized protein LOC143606551 n=1 Tax=Bidens hawaiensis TaxID=980011 RepID=UPI00404B7559